MSTMAYVAFALLWSGLGFAAGYGAGRLARSEDAESKPHPKKNLSALGKRIGGVVLVVLSVATVTLLWQESSDLEDKTDCHTRTFEELKNSFANSVKAGFPQRQAWRDLILQSNPDRPATAEDRRAAAAFLGRSLDDSDMTGEQLLEEIERSNDCDN